ncbi:MAG: hypothetical protein PHP50_07740 [Lachnospiraceae bacterium]|nr:hypothetical protein [Lachnospiraceae bacterium]
MNNETMIRTHRIGTLTFGCMLIVFGFLFLIHLIVPSLSYLWIFRLWPCIFIFLGVEVLMSLGKENVRFVYDKAAVFLMMALTFFAMCMACADWIFMKEAEYIVF